jgi:hypothetical protein
MNIIHVWEKYYTYLSLDIKPTGATRFSEKVGSLERSPLSLLSTTEELLDRKVAAPVKKTEITAVGIRHADHVAPSIGKNSH